jgi:hypothetical protein
MVLAVIYTYIDYYVWREPLETGARTVTANKKEGKELEHREILVLSLNK